MGARRPLEKSEGSRSGPRRCAGRWAIRRVAAASALIMVAACSPQVTHSILTFLYDGVPPLDIDVYQPEIEVSVAFPDAAEGGPAGRVRAAKEKFYYHPAYRKNLCGGCHDAEGGRLLKTARQGLCRNCHPDKPPRKKFIHGPVAVNGCLACHHYHKAPYPKVLVADAQSLCFRCHVEEELTTDKHHATIKQELCIDCHDAHGGDDRYFLLPGVARDGPP